MVDEGWAGMRMGWGLGDGDGDWMRVGTGMGNGTWLLGRNWDAEGCRDPGGGDGEGERGLEWEIEDKEGGGRKGRRQELRTGMGDK